MGSILQSCLAVRGEKPDKDLDPVIESLDDYPVSHLERRDKTEEWNIGM